MNGFWAGYLLGVSQNLVASALLGIPAFLAWRKHHHKLKDIVLEIKDMFNGDNSDGS